MADSLPVSSKKLSSVAAKRIGLLAVIILIAAGTVASLDAEAKRMGGGRSLGRQSQTVKPSAPPAQQPMQQSAQPAQAQRAQPGQAAPSAPAAAPARSRWLGPIAGLAAGLGIAALLSHFGLGEAFAGAMANMIVVAVLAMAGIWLIRKLMSRRRRENAPAYGAAGPGLDAASMSTGAFGANDQRLAGDAYGASRSQAPAEVPFGGAAAPAALGSGTAPALPEGFDAEEFLRHAKVNFVRLQASWDEGNVADIRQFTTPEMFAEVKVDIDARGDERNETDVVQLNAELLELDDRGGEYFASVRFSGLIRETTGAAAQPFAEIWNLSKSARAGEGWLLAGIQQAPLH